MKKILSLLRIAFRPQYLLIWALAVIVVIFSIASAPFRSQANLIEILRSACIFAVMVLGLTWIVALGEIDVTFPDVAAFASMVVAFSILRDIPWFFAIVIAIALSALWGLLSGILINVFKVRALIASIAVATLAKSVAYIFGKGTPIYITAVNPVVNFLVYGKIAGIPVLLIIVVILYVIAAILQNRTKLGQYLYALGENRQAALESGIPEKPIIYSFYILSAVLAGLAGSLMTAAYTSGQPNFLGTYFVDGLSVVFLGALVFKIGKPNVYGTLFGAVMVAVLSNGFTLLGIPYYVGIIVKGILMIIGVAAISSSRNRFLKRNRAARLEAAAKEQA
jgi:ribose transport system permease protein